MKGRRRAGKPRREFPAEFLRRLEAAPHNRPGADKSWVSRVAEESLAYFAAARPDETRTSP